MADPASLYFTDPQASAPGDIYAQRLECILILERCIGEDDLNPFERFVERQIVQDQPPVALLREVAQDLAQRLQNVRQQQFDAREDVLRGILEITGLDCRAWIAADDAALLSLTDTILPLLESPLESDEPDGRLQSLLEQAETAARQRSRRLRLLARAYDILLDWSLALGIVLAQSGWDDNPPEQFVQNIWYRRL